MQRVEEQQSAAKQRYADALQGLYDRNADALEKVKVGEVWDILQLSITTFKDNMGVIYTFVVESCPYWVEFLVPTEFPFSAARPLKESISRFTPKKSAMASAARVGRILKSRLIIYSSFLLNKVKFSEVPSI